MKIRVQDDLVDFIQRTAESCGLSEHNYANSLLELGIRTGLAESFTHMSIDRFMTDMNLHKIARFELLERK